MTQVIRQVNGQLSEVDVVPAFPSSFVMASLTVDQTPLTVGAFTKIVFNTKTTDTLSEYSTATGTFTAANAGTYLVVGFVHAANLADGCDFAVSVFKAGAEFLRVGETSFRNPTNQSGQGASNGSATVTQLVAGDTLDLRAFVNAAVSGTTMFANGIARLTYFTIRRIA